MIAGHRLTIPLVREGQSYWVGIGFIPVAYAISGTVSLQARNLGCSFVGVLDDDVDSKVTGKGT